MKKKSIFERLNDYNLEHKTLFKIDTIRIEFSKQYHLHSLRDFGIWQPVKNKDTILPSLRQRLKKDEITTAYKIKDENIYYFNKKEPRYRKAILVIFGISQPNQLEIPQIYQNILQYFKKITNIDICYDTPIKPNIRTIREHYHALNYKGTNQTYYINNTNHATITKIIIYNKALKNKLKEPLYRVEFTVIISDINTLQSSLFYISNFISTHSHK